MVIGDNRAHQPRFNPPEPHLDPSLVLRRRAEQRRIGPKLLEIARNRRHLADMAAVVQFENGNLAQRIPRQEPRLARLAAGDIDGDHFDTVYAFFGEKHAHPAWARQRLRLV